MMGRHMPFHAVPCSIWLPTYGAEDGYGNVYPTYAEDADVTTTCCYAPGYSRPTTSDKIEQGAPCADEVDMIFFLPKTVEADLRGALIQCYPSDDPVLASERYAVVGEPHSYPRADTPGDYSWYVEGVRFDG